MDLEINSIAPIRIFAPFQSCGSIGSGRDDANNARVEYQGFLYLTNVLF